MKRYHILLVEDDLSLGFLLVEYLESEQYKVKLCRDGASAFKAFQREVFDLCILDIMLPKMDGFTLAEKIRQENPHIPFLFLTARSLKQDKLRGFSLGAEDFITKPFDEEELLCRLEVILRRQEKEGEGKALVTKSQLKQFHIGAYYFDYERQELHFKGKVKRITEKENEVLRLLCIHQNKILRREEAVQQIYGENDYFLGRSFDVFISRIRKLLKQDPRVQVENVFKVGFILNVP